ncbi:hypothetical protein ABZY10_29165 [Streptomyces sp. NPDC006539]|uniref:hypothetical protein n=1 Tax=Streptomyces sp. NPDC006539 TaxID=3155352 RepID=UPI0033BB9A60
MLMVSAIRSIALATGAVLALSACGDTEIGTQNNCSTRADCAGRDHNKAATGKATEPSASSPSSSSADFAESAVPASYSLVYQHKTLGLTLPACDGDWYVDFEERTSKFYSDEEQRNMETQATNTGHKVPLDFYYANCVWGAFGSDNPWGIITTKPSSPEDCADSAQGAGMDSIKLNPGDNQGQVKPGTLICTVTDTGVAFFQVKSFGPSAGTGSMDSPSRLVLDVTLWKKG